MTPLTITAQTTYAELVEQLLAQDAKRSIGAAPGTFVEKQLASGVYVYFQYSLPGGAVRQAYIGPKSRALEALTKRFAEQRVLVRAEHASTQSLCAALRGAGAAVHDAASARVLGALSDSGVFKLGGVLVGTHAFVVLGNVLGVRWDGASARTEDVDIGASRTLEVAVPELEADLPRALESLEMGFLPLPKFSPDAPSTSFKVRGRGLRVDLVTPARDGASEPVPIPRLNAAAAPVRFLELLLARPQPAAVVAGHGILVNVPDPARFALHKLLVAQDRPVALQAKAKKDVTQAAHLVTALAELRPNDVEDAFAEVKSRGKRWRAALERALLLLARHDPNARSLVGAR